MNNIIYVYIYYIIDKLMRFRLLIVQIPFKMYDYFVFFRYIPIDDGIQWPNDKTQVWPWSW